MQNKIADILVNNASVELDKSFSYLVPQRLNNRVQIGSRVLIPFGKGNHKIEGYVLKVHDNKPDVNLKEIYDLIDDVPVFNDKLLKLAFWMKSQYMCTLLDCIKCIIPSGLSLKTNRIVALKKDINVTEVKGKVQKQIIDIVKQKGDEIAVEELKILINSKNYQKSLQSLIDKGILEIKYNFTSSLKSKLIKMVLLNIPIEEAKILHDNLSSKHLAQKRVLNILVDNEFIAASDLVKFANTSYSVINNLYNKGIIRFEEFKVERDPYSDLNSSNSQSFLPTSEQKHALDNILKSIKDNNSDKFLIHGITGSGKTEVYLQAIESVIKIEGHAIVLVPEISLTPQMVNVFKSRFGDKVAVIHSRLSIGERFDQWERIRAGKVNVVVGARSAIFAPFDNLQLIIIDEEHETSYKSETKPKYHVKDIAEMRSKIEKCVVVLGTATPSVNTYYEAKKDKYKLIEMKNRVNKSLLPKVNIVDMRKELEESNWSIFSNSLYEELEKNIQNKEQTILFLNRRGYSTFVSCRKCGLALKCPNCNITLTYHKNTNILMCHYCSYEKRNPSVCPECNSKYIKYFGIGTQKIENEVKKFFPQASVMRMDVDTTGSKFSHRKILDTFKNENIDVLVGTQMIAKGLDFPNVTLVGVVSADTMLNLEDYRSSERTFQLLTQVSGRAGRDKKPGRVIVQTYQPDNFSIITAKNHDYKTFYENEIINRKNLVYPPFINLISIIISHKDNNVARKYAFECATKIKTDFKSKEFKFSILRPTPSPLSKIKKMYRWRILIKVDKNNYVQDILKKIQRQFYNNVVINVDINSYNML